MQCPQNNNVTCGVFGQHQGGTVSVKEHRGEVGTLDGRTQGLDSDGGPFFSTVSRDLWCILNSVDLTLT